MFKAFSLLDDVLEGSFQHQEVLKLNDQELIRRIHSLLEGQGQLNVYHQLKVKSLQHSIRQLVILEEKWILSIGHKSHPATRRINHRLLEKFTDLAYQKLQEVPYRFRESAALVNLRRRRDHFSLTFRVPFHWEQFSHQELAFLYLDLSLYRQYTLIKESIRERCFQTDSDLFRQFVQKLYKFYASSMYNAIRHLGYPLSVKEWEIPPALNHQHFSQKGLFYTEKLMRFLETEYVECINQLDLASPKAIMRAWQELLPAVQAIQVRMMAGEIPCGIARELQRLYQLLHKDGFHGALTHQQLHCIRRIGLDLMERLQLDQFPASLRDWIRFFLHHNANQPSMVQAILQDLEHHLHLLSGQSASRDWLRQLYKCVQQVSVRTGCRYAHDEPDLHTALAQWITCELEHLAEEPIAVAAEPAAVYHTEASPPIHINLFQKEWLTLLRLFEEAGIFNWPASRKELFRQISRHMRTRGSEQPMSEGSLDKAWYSIGARDFARASDLLAELLALAQKNARR